MSLMLFQGEESPLGATASLLLNDLTSGDSGAHQQGSQSGASKLGFSSLLATMRPQQRGKIPQYGWLVGAHCV